VPAPATAPPRRPRVLFVGDDGGSPQIAAEVLRQVAGDQVEVSTADTRPLEAGGRTDEMLVAMGLDPAEEHRLGAGMLRHADRVVVLEGGGALEVAHLPGPRYEQWDLDREDLVVRVEALVDELVPAEAPEPDQACLLDRLRRTLRALARRLRRAR